MFKRTVLTAAILILTVSVHAKEPKISVKLTADELALSLNIHNSIEIRGEEVNPYMDIKNILQNSYKDLSKGKDKSTEVDFTLPMAKNFLFFLQRGKLKGADAQIFSSISSKMVEAIKKTSK